MSLFMVVFYGFSQKNEIDSLSQLLKIEKNNQKKIILNINLFDKVYLKIREKDSAFRYLKTAENLINNTTSDSLKVIIDVNKTQYYLNKDVYDSVFFYAKKALAKKQLLPSTKLVGLYNNIGLASYYRSNYAEALEAHFNSLRVCDSTKNDRHKTQVLNNIGITFIKLKDWDKAEIYMNKSLDLCKQFNIKRGIIYTLGNLGLIYKNQERYDEAISSYFESIELSKTLNNLEAIVRNYLNIGALYEAKNEYSNALETYDKGLAKVGEINKSQLEADLFLSKANIYSKQGKFVLADKNFAQSLMISNEEDLIEVKANTRLGLADSYELRGDFKRAISERKLYRTLQDSILSKEHLSDIKELEIKYQTEKKDSELVQQSLVLEKQKLTIKKSEFRNRLMIAVILFLVIIAGSLFFSYYQRQQRKNQEILTLKREQQVKTLELLMEGEEKERLRIAKELHDGVNVDLSAIKYKLTSLLEKNNQVINEAVTMIDKSCEQVRAISHNLIPPALNDFSLIETLEDFCTTANGIHDPEIVFNHIGEAIKISKKAEVNIFRIVQEIVNNSVKHAEASEITVQISHRSHTLQLTVEDNGIGFARNKVKSKGIGLQNIQSRVDYLNAKLDFDSSDKGTSYIVDINTKELV